MRRPTQSRIYLWSGLPPLDAIQFKQRHHPVVCVAVAQIWHEHLWLVEEVNQKQQKQQEQNEGETKHGAHQSTEQLEDLVCML